MPRKPKRPNKKRPFRLHVMLEGDLVAEVDATAARLRISRSQATRAALRLWTQMTNMDQEKPRS